MAKYAVYSTICVEVDAIDESDADKKATEYFNTLNFKGLDIDVDCAYTIEPIDEE